MALDGISDLLPAAKPIIDVQCDGLTCGDGVPATVRVVVRIRLKDTFFRLVDTGNGGWSIRADPGMLVADDAGESSDIDRPPAVQCFEQ